MPHGWLAYLAAAAWLFAQAAPPGPAELTIDAAASRVEIQVGKAGLLGFAGHAHEVVAPAIAGRVVFDPADWQRTTVSVVFDASALRVTGKGEPAADVPEVQRVMLGSEVLNVARFPIIAFESRRIAVAAQTGASATALIEGDLTLHGTTRPVAIHADVAVDVSGRVTARGTFSLKQTDFGLEPVTAGGGTVRVKDELDVQFVLSARPSR